jgi:STE24 endopeptidase
MYLEAVVAFIVADFLFKRFIGLRQREHYLRTDIPAALKGSVTFSDMAKANGYALDKNAFSNVSATFAFVVALVSLYFGVLPLLWRWSHWSDNEIVHSLGFSALMLVVDLVLDTPWELYNTFAIEQRHGFNKSTLRLFALDKAKGLVLMCGIGAPVVASVIWIVRWAGAAFVWYLFSFVVAIQLLLVLVLADPIMRWFNMYKPLEEGSLKTAVQDLCNRVRYDIKESYVVDGSTRSSHSNAYFMSLLWVKKLVIYDTLVTDKGGVPVPEQDVLAVIAHEISHWRCGHTNKLLVLQLLLQFAQFQLLSTCLFNESLFREFGFATEMPVVIGLALFAKLIAPIDFFLEVGINVISRRFEYEADQGAIELGYPNMGSALIRIHVDNKAPIHNDWLYSACTASHPSLLERLDAISRHTQRIPMPRQGASPAEKVKSRV